MKVYRIRHIPTGMYWVNSRHINVYRPETADAGWVKSNLSKRGKVYAKKPSTAFIRYGYYNHLTIEWEFDFWINSYKPVRQKITKFDPAEWQIEEMETV